MPPSTHAILSASSAHRWLACPPSAMLCAREKCEDTDSTFAKEGTCAHALCEYRLKSQLGIPAEEPVDLEFRTDEMGECAEDYASFVMETMLGMPEPTILIEQRLDFSRWVPNGFGTGDCVIVADGVLRVIDFKYGEGILVEAKENPQMMLYALGALDLFDCLYEISRVEMTIFQPRRQNVDTWVISREELLDWAETELKPKAELAAKGEGEFQAGAHCRFCKVKTLCRERARRNMELARYDFSLPPTLDDGEIVYILSKADDLAGWVADLKEYALQAALSGKKWEGYKLVEGRAVRKYTDEKAVAEAVKQAGYDPFEHKVLGITAMTSMLGKKKFESLLGSYVIKPQGKPTLVPESDKRPAINDAKSDFEKGGI